MQKEKNYVFIDGQNLHMGVTNIENPWKIDFKKFRIFLKDKYHASIVYYFLGCVFEEKRDLYTKLQEAGFCSCFQRTQCCDDWKEKGECGCRHSFFGYEKAI